jgi:hypothetical protein
MKGNEYVAEKLSGMSATDGKEGSHRNGPLLVRQIRLEGLATSGEFFTSAFEDRTATPIEDDEPRSEWPFRGRNAANP